MFDIASIMATFSSALPKASISYTAPHSAALEKLRKLATRVPQINVENQNSNGKLGEVSSTGDASDDIVVTATQTVGTTDTSVADDLRNTDVPVKANANIDNSDIDQVDKKMVDSVDNEEVKNN